MEPCSLGLPCSAAVARGAMGRHRWEQTCRAARAAGSAWTVGSEIWARGEGEGEGVEVDGVARR
jgi:hypothetical protein